MAKPKSGQLKLQSIIAIAALILTPLFTALVTRYQIDKNFEVWKQQQQISGEVTLHETKLRTVQEVSELFSRMYFLRGRLDSAFLTLCAERALIDVNQARGTDLADRYINILGKATNEYEQVLIKLRSSLNNAKYIFGREVDLLIESYSGALKTDRIVSFVDSNQVMEFLIDSVSKGNSPMEALDQFKKKYSSEKETDPAEQLSRKVVSAMWQELYNNEDKE